MSIKFKKDLDKIGATILFFASKHIPELTVGKICKLVFYADKLHLVRFGKPITGDNYFAMVDGPIPSTTYDFLKRIRDGKLHIVQVKELASKLRIDRQPQDPVFSTTANYNADLFSQSNIDTLNAVIQRLGDKSFDELSIDSHKLTAYDKAWKKRGDKDVSPMEFEDFFEGDRDALVGAKEEMVETHHLNCSFAKS